MELRRETGSHLFAETHDYDWAASHAEVAQIVHAEWYANVHRDRDVMRTPIRFPRPWREKDPNADVTAEERAELEQMLLARSALRDR